MMETYGCPFDVAWFIWIKAGVMLCVLVLAIVALLALRRRPLAETPRFLWALLILLAPILGPVVFFIVRPENLDEEQRKTV